MRGRRLVWLGLLYFALSCVLLVYELRRPLQLIIQWETETEVATAGFGIYRADAPDGPYERINSVLIPSRGDPLVGASYEYVDSKVRPNQTYYYQLEEIEVDGRTNRMDLAVGKARGAQLWVVIPAGIGILVGVHFFLSGVQHE